MFLKDLFCIAHFLPNPRHGERPHRYQRKAAQLPAEQRQKIPEAATVKEADNRGGEVRPASGEVFTVRRREEGGSDRAPQTAETVDREP